MTVDDVYKVLSLFFFYFRGETGTGKRGHWERDCGDYVVRMFFECSQLRRGKRRLTRLTWSQIKDVAYLIQRFLRQVRTVWKK